MSIQNLRSKSVAVSTYLILKTMTPMTVQAKRNMITSKFGEVFGKTRLFFRNFGKTEINGPDLFQLINEMSDDNNQRFRKNFLDNSQKQRKGKSFSEVYSLQRLLGKGSFGKVYKCQHKQSKTMHACKVLENFNHDQEYALRIEQEITHLKKLDHPNLLKFQAVFRESDKVYLVTELIEGGELKYNATNSRSREMETKKMAYQILTGISYMHSAHNMMHSDLKAENITLNGQIPKIIDLGLAQTFQTPNSPVKRPLQGTPRYMSPQQWSEGPRGVFNKMIFGGGAVSKKIFSSNFLSNLWNRKERNEKNVIKTNDEEDPDFLPSKYSEKCDMYAFGVTLLRMLIDGGKDASGKDFEKKFFSTVTNRSEIMEARSQSVVWNVLEKLETFKKSINTKENINTMENPVYFDATTISPEAIAFLKGLLAKEEKDRLDVKSALGNTWFDDLKDEKLKTHLLNPLWKLTPLVAAMWGSENINFETKSGQKTSFSKTISKSKKTMPFAVKLALFLTAKESSDSELIRFLGASFNEARELFLYGDKNSDGRWSEKEWDKVFQHVKGISIKRESQNLKTKTFTEIDIDGNKVIGWTEFLAFFCSVELSGMLVARGGLKTYIYNSMQEFMSWLWKSESGKTQSKKSYSYAAKRILKVWESEERERSDSLFLPENPSSLHKILKNYFLAAKSEYETANIQNLVSLSNLKSLSARYDSMNSNETSGAQSFGRGAVVMFLVIVVVFLGC